MAPISIVQTKLNRPPVHDGLVRRERLNEAMESALCVPLTVVRAPAGYGKSTAVGQWIETRGPRSAWISLDPIDGDLYVFTSYLIAAIGRWLPDALAGTRAALGGPRRLRADDLAREIANDLELLDAPIAVVLDDYQRIEASSEVHSLLRALVERPPSNLHLVLITRTPPPLPLARLRASGALTEIRGDDLRFAPEEADAFFRANSSKELSAPARSRLQYLLEGWAVGMRLMALALHRVEDPDAYLRELPGAPGDSRDYLLEQVMLDLPPEVQRWLFRVSVVERFSGGLLEALRPDDAPVDGRSASGGELIETMLRSDVFAIPLDTTGVWFRHHHLFRSFLQSELEKRATAEEVREIRLRASRWFEAEGMVDEAIRQAMRAGAADDAADILLRVRHGELNRDRAKSVERWLALLPSSLVAARPDLMIASAYGMVERHELEAIPPLLATAEEALDGEPTPPTVAGELDLHHGYHHLMVEGDTIRAVDRFDRALEGIPAAHEAIRSEAILDRSLALQMQGQEVEVIGWLEELVNASPAPGDLMKSRLLAAKTMVQLLSGNVAAATRAAERTTAAPGIAPYSANWAEYLRGLATLEQMKLESALEAFSIAAAQPDSLHTRAALDAFAGAASTLDAMGRAVEADETLAVLAEFVARTSTEESRIVSESARARHQLATGDVDSAFRWARAIDLTSSEPLSLFWSEVPRLTVAHAFMAEGSKASLERASELLAEARASVLPIHNGFQTVKVTVPLALVHRMLGRDEAAARLLDEVVAFAAHRGWLRPFVEAGPPMVEMLERPREDADAEVGRLQLLASIARGRGASSRPPSPRDALDSEPPDLTNRELDVLELAARRLQNKEIADELSISYQTVGSHLKRAYRKLGVGTRREATRRARELGLIPS